MSTTEWAGPARFRPPSAPVVADDGSRRCDAVTYAAGWSVLWVISRVRSCGVWLRLLVRSPGLDTRGRGFVPRPRALLDHRNCDGGGRSLSSFAADLGVDASRIGIWGESAGPHLATLVGLTGGCADLEGDLGVVGPGSAVDVVVDWRGPADIEAMLGLDRAALMPPGLPSVLRTSPEEPLVRGLEGAVLADASPATHVASGAPPFLVQHGTAGWVVPFDHSELLTSRLREAGVPVELEAVEGAGHIFAGHDDIDGVVRRSVAFLTRHLAP